MQIIILTYEFITLTDLIYVTHFSLHHSNSLPWILPEVATPQQYSTNCMCVCVYLHISDSWTLDSYPPPKPSLSSLLQQTFSEIKFSHCNLHLTIYQLFIYYLVLSSTSCYHYFVFLQRPKYKQGWALNIMTDLTDSRQVEITS